MQPSTTRSRIQGLAATFVGLLAVTGCNSSALAITLSYPLHPGATPLAIPDNDLTPTVLNLEITDSAITSIQSVEFDLHLAGTQDNPGFAGDLVVFLVRNLDQTAFLLNRVGVGIGTGATATTGYAYSGWNVTFSDNAGSPGIHNTEPDPGSELLTGSWAPDARAYPGDPSTLDLFGLGIFAGAPANGTWRLALIDASPGGTVWLEAATLRITGESAAPIPDAGATGALTAATLLLGGVLVRLARRA